MPALSQKKPTGVFDYLPIVILDKDQPTTCPRCSARTDDITSDQTLICICKSCNFTFRGKFK